MSKVAKDFSDQGYLDKASLAIFKMPAVCSSLKVHPRVVFYQ